jgi:predicted Holliday junction resolvase-like endonuclease
MEYVILVLIFLIIALIYAIYNLLSKLEKYEDFIEADQRRNEALLEALKSIDSKEMFEKDDEVGSLFTQIKETIQLFKEFNKDA